MTTTTLHALFEQQQFIHSFSCDGSSSWPVCISNSRCLCEATRFLVTPDTAAVAVSAPAPPTEERV